MKISAVANQLGINPSTIRYYEKVGLIEFQSRVSGVREFDKNSILTLKFIKLAQSVGFSLAEIKRLIENYPHQPQEKGVCHPFAEAKQLAIREQIEELKKMDRILSSMLNCQCSTLSECIEFSINHPEINGKP